MSRYSDKDKDRVRLLRENGLSIREIAKRTGINKSSVGVMVSPIVIEDDGAVTSRHEDMEQSSPVSGGGYESSSIFDKLKDLSFKDWNNVVGLPVKQKRGPLPILDYEWEVFNELFKVDGTEKDGHVAWLAARGLGKSELCIRILSWLATKDDSLKGSEMVILTGNRQALANSLISRIKRMFINAGFTLPDTATNIVDLNGVRIEGYPAAGNTEAARGKPWVSVIWLDESSFWLESEITAVMDVIQGYFHKSNPYCLITSSPKHPEDLMDQIFKQPEDECVWRRLKHDWRYGEGTMFLPVDIARIRKTGSWGREMELRFISGKGNTFRDLDIERCQTFQYDPDLISRDTVKVIGLDPAWGSSAFGIVVLDWRDDHACVLVAEEHYNSTQDQMIDYVCDLIDKYDYVERIYVDASQISFIKGLKYPLKDETDYHKAIDRYKASKTDWTKCMRVVPVVFTVKEKQQMLSNTKMMLEDGSLAIDPRFDKLLTSLHTCIDTDGIIDKNATNHDDILDSLQMALKEYQI